MAALDERPRPEEGERADKLLRPLYLRNPRRVELAYSLAPERLELTQTTLALTDELGHVHAQSLGFEFLEADCAVAQEAGGAPPVAVLEVVEADAYLQDALVKKADSP